MDNLESGSDAKGANGSEAWRGSQGALEMMSVHALIEGTLATLV